VLKSASILGRVPQKLEKEQDMSSMPRFYSEKEEQDMHDWAMEEARRQLSRKPMRPLPKRALPKSKPQAAGVLEQLAAMGVECRRLKLLVNRKASASISTCASDTSHSRLSRSTNSKDSVAEELSFESSINEEASFESWLNEDTMTATASQSTVCSITELEHSERESFSITQIEKGSCLADCKMSALPTDDSNQQESMSSDSGKGDGW